MTALPDSRTPSVSTLRARRAALARHRAANDPANAAAEQELRAAVLERHIKKLVDSAPPLTVEQRDRLAQLLRSDATAGAA